jgi:hypothetical protein
LKKWNNCPKENQNHCLFILPGANTANDGKLHKNPDVIKELNENFYFISFDAESKREFSIIHTLTTGTNTGIHELATALTIDDKCLSHIDILDTDYTITLQKHSYLNAKSVLSILEKNKSLFFEEFLNQYETLQLHFHWCWFVCFDDGL